MGSIERHANPRKQGDAGLGIAIGWFACNGYTVCVPPTDSQPFDLVVDSPAGLQRVQVRTTTRPNHEINLRTQGGNFTQRMVVRHFDASHDDLLFAVRGDGTCFLLPTAVIKSRSTIVLGPKVAAYQLRV
ncbi:MAG: group I intron-associated PD-(D/E)XK endonuclease [Ilumatobacteraceae bacterium]